MVVGSNDVIEGKGRWVLDEVEDREGVGESAIVVVVVVK